MPRGFARISLHGLAQIQANINNKPGIVFPLLSSAGLPNYMKLDLHFSRITFKILNE